MFAHRHCVQSYRMLSLNYKHILQKVKLCWSLCSNVLSEHNEMCFFFLQLVIYLLNQTQLNWINLDQNLIWLDPRNQWGKVNHSFTEHNTFRAVVYFWGSPLQNNMCIWTLKNFQLCVETTIGFRFPQGVWMEKKEYVWEQLCCQKL